MSPEHASRGSKAQLFEATHWSLVLKAGRINSPEREAALASLCEAYWPPLYAFVRRTGLSPEDAQDMVQGFFTRLLEKNYLATVDPTRGKFRSFLLMAIKRFMANEWDKANRLKRGGGLTLISLDERDSEDRLLAEPASFETPEKTFERRWALKLLEQVLKRLEREFSASGKAEQFVRLKSFLTARKAEVSLGELAQELGTTEGALKTAVHRIRQRYRELLREEIANTVSAPHQIDEELRHLFAALT